LHVSGNVFLRISAPTVDFGRFSGKSANAVMLTAQCCSEGVPFGPFNAD
jgi:hypothetical protein